MTHIELLRGEVFGECIEQIVVARRVRVAEVVDGVDDPFTHHVEPDAVGDGLRKERIARRSQPVGEGIATVVSRLHVGVADTDVARLHLLAGTRLRHFAIARNVHDFGTVDGWVRLAVRARIGFLFHTGKPCREAVVIVLRPAFKRVIVALRTLHSHAHKQLCGTLGERHRIFRDAVVVRGGVVERVAIGGQQLANDAVDRGVVRDAATQPSVECVRAFHLNRFAARTKHIRPLERPKVGKLGLYQKVIDQRGPLRRRGIGEERLRFLIGRHSANRIEVRSANVFVIGR